MTVRQPKVTTVIVTYQSRATIGAALDALFESYQAGLCDVVVVDNASTDGTAEYVAEIAPWVLLIRSDVNLGFGRGCNKGFEHVSTEYVLILNPDASLGVRALEALVSFMDKHPSAGIASPAIQEGDNAVLQAAGLMTTPMTVVRGSIGSSQPFKKRRAIVPGGDPFRTSWVCGAIMLIRTKLFRSLGGFDPRFFLYFEETDLCRRAAECGSEIWAVGSAVAKHIGGASAKAVGGELHSSCLSEHYYRSRFYYLVKHFGWLRALITEATVILAEKLRLMFRVLAGKGKRREHRVMRRPLFQMPLPIPASSRDLGRHEI